MGVISYEYGPGPVPGWGRVPEGAWIRLVPFALSYPRVVEFSREERGGFVYVDKVYDLKLFGAGDFFGSGPDLVVSEDFAAAIRATGLGGLAFEGVAHATPFSPRVRRPLSCRPTHHATAVSDRVALIPPSHPKGRSYGYHGRPTEPLEIMAPPMASSVAFGGPWFATASLPFQPLIVPSTFLSAFREHVGRDPRLGWEDVRIVESVEHALVARVDTFGGSSADPGLAGYASFDEALATVRRDAPVRGHVIVGAEARPRAVAPAAWSELARVAGSVFFRGAFGLFPATEADRVAMDPACISARNVPEYCVMGDPSLHASSVEIGYPLEPDWTLIGWFAGEMPSFLAITPDGDVRRCEANGEVNLCYPSFGDFFADLMADLQWAFENGKYGWQWLGG